MSARRPTEITIRRDATRGWQATDGEASVYGTSREAAVGALLLHLLADGHPVLVVRVTEAAS